MGVKIPSVVSLVFLGIMLRSYAHNFITRQGTGLKSRKKSNLFCWFQIQFVLKIAQQLGVWLLKILKFIIKSQNFIDPKFESGLGNKQTTN